MLCIFIQFLSDCFAISSTTIVVVKIDCYIIVVLCSLLGEFEDAELGNVYAADRDDWDVENKTFSFVDKEAERHFRYTSSSKHTTNRI